MRRLWCALVWALLLSVSPLFVIELRAAVTVRGDGDKSQGNSGTTQTLTLAGADQPQAGDTIAVCGISNGSTASPTVSDNNGGSYSAVVSSELGTAVAALRWAINVAGGSTTLTVTYPSGVYRVVFAVALGGLATTSIEDDITGTASGSASPQSSAATPSMTATQAAAALGCMQVYELTTITPDGAQTQLGEDETFVNASGSFDIKSVSAGTTALSWNFGTAGPWVAVGAVLKEASGGGPAACRAGIGLTGFVC